MNITHSDQDSRNYTAINTTYWPSMIRNVTFDSFKIVGLLILDHLPQTIETFIVEGCCLDINLTDISHLYNLHTLVLASYGNHYGIAKDLREKLPEHVNVLKDHKIGNQHSMIFIRVSIELIS